VILDVRGAAERQEARIAGSIGIPLTHLAERLSELPPDRPILVHCAGGYRSSIAASLLQRHGLAAGEIAGGMAAWEAGGLPVERSAADADGNGDAATPRP
jgi:rhodanese-related sulfurtransferase